MSTKIVLGLQYGDEGKGLVTSSPSSEKDLVIRHSGGSQAGHTVVKDGYRHVFSSIGAGTLNGATTYLSEYFALCPISYKNESDALIKNGYYPETYVDPLAAIITPYDKIANQKRENHLKHGSVGIGFGTTIERQQTPYTLYAVDLQYPVILDHKMEQIRKYYGLGVNEIDLSEFYNAVNLRNFVIKDLKEIKYNYENIIFEGSQGIMLDMDHGFFPHVTRSNTTSKNALSIIEKYNLVHPDIYYVMRSYATRHGNGPFPGESTDFFFEDKTNQPHKFQGKFRQGYHDLEMLRYALEVDKIYHKWDYNLNLVVTHLNLTDNLIKTTGRDFTLDELKNKLNISRIHGSYDEQTVLYS